MRCRSRVAGGVIGAMVEAMVFGALRRAELLGLRLDDVKIAERLVFIVNGKGGLQRLVPVSARFVDSVANYLRVKRPKTAATDRVIVVLKGPNGVVLGPNAKPSSSTANAGTPGLNWPTPSSSTSRSSTTRQPRHSSRGMLSAIEYEHRHAGKPARDQAR